jgi:hypothetical protein
MKLAVVDIQGFYIQSKFYPKEMSIQISKKSNHYIFKEPYPFEMLDGNDKKTICYTEKIHGIKYVSGYIASDEINNILIEHLSDVDTVYTRGINKKKILIDKTRELDLFVNIVDICKFDNSTTVRQPSKIEPTRTPMCLNHDHLPARCTQNVTNEIYEWLRTTLPE